MIFLHSFMFVGKIALPDWDVESTGQKVAIPADVFLNHVANLHCEGDGGNHVFQLNHCLIDYLYDQNHLLFGTHWINPWVKINYFNS